MAASYLKEAFESLTPDNHFKETITEIINDSNYRISCLIKFQATKIKKAKRHNFLLQLPSKTVKEKFSPKKYQETFQEKAEKNKIFAMKLIKEQKERENRLAKKEKKIKDQELKEIEKQEMRKEMELLGKIKKKQDQINLMIEKSKERKEKLLFLKKFSEKEYQKARSITPLFKRIENEFVEKVQLPELEKRRSELKKKKEFFKQINYSELKKHALDHDLLINSLSQQHIIKKSEKKLENSKIYKKSQFFNRLIEEDKQIYNENRENSMKKQKMREKVKKYSDLVREIFSPTVDDFKKKEMEFITARLSNAALMRPKKIIQSVSDEDRVQRIKKNYSFTHKDINKKTQNSELLRKKSPIVKDYIDEFRQSRLKKNKSVRIDWEQDLSDDISKQEKIFRVRKKAECMEKEARKNEMKMAVMSPFNRKVYQISDYVNELLLSSVKAKLAIAVNI